MINISTQNGFVTGGPISLSHFQFERYPPNTTTLSGILNEIFLSKLFWYNAPLHGSYTNTVSLGNKCLVIL